MIVRGGEFRSIAIPPLGSGLGGPEWSGANPRIESALRGFNGLQVILFEPGGSPVAASSIANVIATRILPGN